MNTKSIIKANGLKLYVKEVFVFESKEKTKKARLPFFADGYPGLIFLQAEQGAFISPQNKKLSPFFLYGQTIQPIVLSIKGKYRMIVFQLYPFASKVLFGINPREINDDCYDLASLKRMDIRQVISDLSGAGRSKDQTGIIAGFLSMLVRQAMSDEEQKMQIAINLILQQKGRISIGALTKKLHITERTLQRKFIEYIGISPKQFARIIQFQASFDQISNEAFSRLTEIVYENGYADQSHFIRSFRKFTGEKPSRFKMSR